MFLQIWVTFIHEFLIPEFIELCAATASYQ